MLVLVQFVLCHVVCTIAVVVRRNIGFLLIKYLIHLCFKKPYIHVKHFYFPFNLEC